MLSKVRGTLVMLHSALQGGPVRSGFPFSAFLYLLRPQSLMSTKDAIQKHFWLINPIETFKARQRHLVQERMVKWLLCLPSTDTVSTTTTLNTAVGGRVQGTSVLHLGELFAGPAPQSSQLPRQWVQLSVPHSFV